MLYEVSIRGTGVLVYHLYSQGCRLTELQCVMPQDNLIGNGRTGLPDKEQIGDKVMMMTRYM